MKTFFSENFYAHETTHWGFFTRVANNNNKNNDVHYRGKDEKYQMQIRKVLIHFYGALNLRVASSRWFLCDIFCNEKIPLLE